MTAAEHGRVLDLRGDDVPSLKTARQHTAQDCEVVRLGAAARKDDLVGAGTEETRHPLTRLFDGIAGPQTVGVQTRRIPEGLGQERIHRLPDGWVQWRGRIMVKVDEGFRHATLRTARALPSTP